MTDGSTAKKEQYHFMVVVLGDLGRSPRMQYHVLSLLQAGHCVTFVGYTGEQLIPALQTFASSDDDDKSASKKATLQVVRFPAPKIRFLRSSSILLPLYFLWRIMSLMILLFVALVFFVKPVQLSSSSGSQRVYPQAILMQNPPAIPVLLVMVLYKLWTHSKLIIDWHNLGYSMIDKQYATFRALGRTYEQTLAPYADGHLTVTKAMRNFLKSDLNIQNENCSVLYDCPPSIFRLRTLTEQHQVMAKHHDNIMQALKNANITEWPELTSLAGGDASKATFLTEPMAGRPGRYQPRTQRPALIVSSTSWTPDEDMGILIDALQLVDKQIQETKSSLRIICAITGKGRLKEHYEREIEKKAWKSVVVTTLWIEPADYPTFLACADAGISLHTSTSGLDLPIKILDYFGCEVPVCAYRFPCLNELVQDDVNGRTFEDSGELKNILLDLLQPLASAKPNERLGNHSFGALKRYSLQVQGQLLWSENWPHGWKVLENALTEKSKAE